MTASLLPRPAVNLTRAAVTVSLLLTLLGGAALFWPVGTSPAWAAASTCIPAGLQP